MSETVPFTLETSSGPLHGLADLPDLPGERPTVVICHGFKGFMEWGFFPYLAALMAERGFVAVRFNLSGTGMRPGDELVTDLDAFRDNTYRRELADLLAILEAAGETIASGRVDRDRIGLFGHSRGGGNAVLAAARSPWRERLRALVTWASIATVDRFSPEQKAEWRRQGEMPAVNSRTGQRLALGLGLLAEMEETPRRARHPRRRRDPPRTLADRPRRGRTKVFLPTKVQKLIESANGEKELRLIPGANHTFGSRHPFAGPTPQLVQALNATQRWYRSHL